MVLEKNFINHYVFSTSDRYKKKNDGNNAIPPKTFNHTGKYVVHPYLFASDGIMTIHATNTKYNMDSKYLSHFYWLSPLAF